MGVTTSGDIGLHVEAGIVLANDHVSCVLITGLRHRGVRAILLKGASLRRLVYDQSEVRVSADVDVLVDEGSIDTVEAALSDLGFQYLGVTVADGRRHRRRAWVHEPTGIPLELHTSITGMEASLRFGGPETLETKIFGRLSAWQNWIFQRPNAVGPKGALQVYGSGQRGDFDRRRV